MLSTHNRGEIQSGFKRVPRFIDNQSLSSLASVPKSTGEYIYSIPYEYSYLAWKFLNFKIVNIVGNLFLKLFITYCP